MYHSIIICIRLSKHYVKISNFILKPHIEEKRKNIKF